MSLNAEKKILPKISMRKTKKRVAAATKLQALARGIHARSKQKQQNTAATKLQALASETGVLPMSRSNSNESKDDPPISLILLASPWTTQRSYQASMVLIYYTVSNHGLRNHSKIMVD